jgi:hypothetical protein
MKGYLATLSLLIALPCPAQLHYKEKQVVAYAKAIDVKTLDPALPSQRLEDWLQSGPPHAHIGYWSADTCDIKPVSPHEDYPLCVKVSLSRNGKGGFFLVRVGNIRRGIVGRPRLYGDIEIWKTGTWTSTVSAERLSDLPALLD